MSILTIDPFKQNPSLETQYMSLPPDTSLDTLFHVLLKKLKIDGVDSKPWSQKLQNNLVMNLGLLMRLSEEAVKKLELPLLIQDELIKIIKQDPLALVQLSVEKVNPPLGCPFHVPKQEVPKVEVRSPSPASSSTDVREVRKSASAMPVSTSPREPKTQRAESCPVLQVETRDRSSSFGAPDNPSYIPKHQIWTLDKNQRDILKRTWSEITKRQGDHLVNLFDNFYGKFFEIDPAVKRLFHEKSMPYQARALMQMVTMLMKCIDRLDSLTPQLEKLGVSHVIYGVEVKDFQSWAISLVSTFEAVLGKEAFGKTEKDAWMAMIAGVSSIIINSYDAARAGKSGFCEVSFGGKSFKKYWCSLTHDKLAIYRDKKQTKLRCEFPLKELNSVEIEDSGVIHGPTLHVLKVDAENDDIYFAISSEEEMKKWKEEFSMRIKAMQRVLSLGENQKNSSSVDE
jgi:hemoglobin-like flavoprotein